jgi:uncharacterized CHY-type Zn-finger protein
VRCSKCSNVLPEDTPLGEGHSCPFCGDEFATLSYEEHWPVMRCGKCGVPLTRNDYKGTGEGGPFDGWELETKCRNCGMRNTMWTH